MKKLIMGFALAALVATASCSKKSNDEAGASIDDRFKIEKSLGDSISMLYGKMVGGYILSDFQNFQADHQNPQMKDDLLKGIRKALSEGQSEGVVMGMQVGMRMAQELKDLESRGVPVNRELVLKNFIAAFNADSLNMIALRQDNADFSILVERVSAIDAARKEAELAEAPEAKQNAISGKAFVEKAKAADPAIKTTDSGLSYKIEAQGDTTTITNRSTVTLNYTGRLIDGTVFDQTQPDKPATFSLGNTVPGFAEGVALLGKGGKATLYIPAELAYGVNAPAQIGPNQTLVFDIEVVDVK